MQEGAEKGFKRYHLLSFSRAHPHLDGIRPATIILGVKPMELPASIRRPNPFDLDFHTWHVKRAANLIDDFLRESLYSRAVILLQRLG